MYGYVHVLINMMCNISASMKTRANVFLFVFSIISFVFVLKLCFLFVFLKDRLDFCHLARKVNGLFV